MHDFDVIVIGGGLLGCFVARNLAKYRLKIAIFEEREDLCTGISRANTAIVYSGCDTRPGTLKSRMCVKAAQSFDSLCSELGVRYKQCGSIMVCFGPKGEEVLRKKYSQGLENGVRGLRLLEQKEVLALEPGLSSDVQLGLYAPEAGTVLPWELGLAAAENAASNGVEIMLNTKVTDIERTEDGYIVHAAGGSFSSQGVINCAGMFADEILEKVQNPLVRIIPDSGDYFVLDTKADGCIKHVIFHEPEEKGKGLTLVPTVEGNILIGPTKNSSDEKDAFKTTSSGLEKLRALVSEVVPTLPMEHVIRSFGAIRPNPCYVHLDSASGSYVPIEKTISGFTIVESEETPSFISLIGIKTPGLTCANELGCFVADRISSLLRAEVNTEFNPQRDAPLRLNDLSFRERSNIILKNSSYGKIICRCRNISEGEIIDSIRRKPGAVTVEGVKRRTGACSGRCQGSFCTQRIIELLAREQSVFPNAVAKDGPGSYMIWGGKKDGNKNDRV
ncbi:MAG: NAD(P)/FAD-dependent oxidoreductase [Acidaminococcaceae bacterium]